MELMRSVYNERCNIARVRKNFYVNIELIDGTIYDIYFRNSGDRDENSVQIAVMKNTFINDIIGVLPVFMENVLAYIHIDSDDIVMKSSSVDKPTYYNGYELVTYEIFDGAKWAGSFSYPPT